MNYMAEWEESASGRAALVELPRQLVQAALEFREEYAST